MNKLPTAKEKFDELKRVTKENQELKRMIGKLNKTLDKLEGRGSQ